MFSPHYCLLDSNDVEMVDDILHSLGMLTTADGLTCLDILFVWLDSILRSAIFLQNYTEPLSVVG